jgi:hypothetical protein
MTPSGVALTSNRMYTQTVDGASLIPEAIGTFNPDVPAVTVLLQNYPNPFNPTTIIRYGLPQKADVRLIVYNTLGQTVAALVNETQNVGYHEVRFDGINLASGVYFYRIQTGGFVQTKKLLLLR